MHSLFLKQLCWLVAGLPVAAWCMYVAMRFLIFGVAADILRIYYEGLEGGRILFTIVEIGFFSAFNKLRHYTVTEAHKALIPALQRWLPVIQVYTTILWAIAMYYLVLRLSVAMPAFSLNMVIQFLLLVLGLMVMMGIALPFSALRGWVFIWYRRKLDEKF